MHFFYSQILIILSKKSHVLSVTSCEVVNTSCQKFDCLWTINCENYCDLNVSCGQNMLLVITVLTFASLCFTTTQTLHFFVFVVFGYYIC